MRARRLRYFARVPGEPTAAQREMARSMAVLEWGALQAEAEGTMQALREAREHRRLLLRVLADYERTLAPAPRSSPRARAGPAQIDLEQHLGKLGVVQGRQAANGSLEPPVAADGVSARLEEQADLFGEVPQDD